VNRDHTRLSKYFSVTIPDNPRPELLRTLRYVDCTSHAETQIERQFRDLIDALNEIELNPYR